MSTWAKALLCLVAVTGCGSPSTPRPRAPTAAAQRYRARAPRGLHLALELGIKVALLGDRFRSANAEAWVAAHRLRARLRGAAPPIVARLGHLELRCCRRGLLDRWSGRYSWLDHEKRTFSFGRGSGLDVQVVAASPTRSAPGPRMLGHTTRRSAITLDLQVRDVRLARALELVVWHTRDATLVDHRRALLGVVLPHLSGGVARDLRRRLAGELGFPLAWQLTLRASPAAVSRIIGKGGRAAAFGAFGALLPLTIKVAVKRVTPTNVRLQDFELSPRDYTQR